jgi:hypothetical protein
VAESAVPILPSRDFDETLAFYSRLAFELQAAGVESDPVTGSRLMPPVDTDYGIREFALVDRSGNLVRVGSPL